MYNGVQMMAADPLALLPGAVGQQSPAQTRPADGFESLLNLIPLSPPTESPGGQAPEDIPDVTLNAVLKQWPGEAIPVFLPGELLTLAGQETSFVPDVVGQTELPRHPSGMLLVGAELLPPDNSDGDALCLNVRVPSDVTAALPETKESAGEPQEMILPMRLRTVEYRGGRIIADAEMLTATGKDVPIRLQVNLAGSLPQLESRLSAGGGNERAVRGQAPLPRLLQELDVTSIVIERYALDEMPAVRPGFTGTIGSPGSTSGTEPGSDLTGAVRPIGGDPGAMQLQTPAVTSPTGSEPVISDSGKQQEASKLFEQLSGIAGEPSAASKAESVPVQAVSALSESSVLDAGSSEPGSDRVLDPSQVRFYDLDHKLGQLKQNPGQRITIQLMPPRLGKMELSIVSHRGLITVNLGLESTQAKQAVEQNLGQLERQLASSGIKVDAFQLHVNQPERTNMFAQIQQTYYQGGRWGHGGRNFRHTPYHQQPKNGIQLSDTGFQQELVNCLA